MDSEMIVDIGEDIETAVKATLKAKRDEHMSKYPIETPEYYAIYLSVFGIMIAQIVVLSEKPVDEVMKGVNVFIREAIAKMQPDYAAWKTEHKE